MNSPIAIWEVIPFTRAAERLERSPVPNVKSNRGVLAISRFRSGSIALMLLLFNDPMKINIALIGSYSSAISSIFELFCSIVLS